MSHPRHPRRLLSALLLAAGVATTMPALAAQDNQTQLYDVEILVFANNNPDDQGEQWPANPGIPDLSGSAELGAPDGPTQLGPASFRLRADDAALKRSGRYQPILHMAWRQAAEPLDAGHGVHIHGPGNSDTVNGTVKLSEGRYLHLDIDLLYYPAGGPTGSTGGSVPAAAQNGPSTPDPTGNTGADGNPPGAPADAASPLPTPAGATDTGAGQTTMPAPKVWVSDPGVFRLDQHRKLRTGRVQYFDQPHFGVLALVTPYTPPKPKPETPAAGSGDNAPANDTSAAPNGQ